MSNVIFDASVLLALIKNERGSEEAEKFLGRVTMSCMNISEAAAVLVDSGMSEEESREAVEPLVDSAVAFDSDQAFSAASLKNATKSRRLSLGDRACLALGLKLGLPVYTAERVWGALRIEGLEVKLLR